MYRQEITEYEKVDTIDFGENPCYLLYSTVEVDKGHYEVFETIHVQTPPKKASDEAKKKSKTVQPIALDFN